MNKNNSFPSKKIIISKRERRWESNGWVEIIDNDFIKPVSWFYGIT